MEFLLKAHKVEVSPYKAINQLTDKWEKYVHEVTRLLIGSICKSLGIRELKKAHEDAPLVFKGRIQYNPKTGKPIKEAAWRKLEESIIKYLGIEKNLIQRKMINDSFWLGTLINRLADEQKRIGTPLSRFDIDNPDFIGYNYKDYGLDRIIVEKRLAGIYIQNITERARAKVQTIIVNGTREKKPKYRLFQDLWDQEEDINRDWDRVVRTEVAAGTNNGLMISMLRTSEEDHIFVKGISSPDACPYCIRLLADKIFVLLEEGPADGGDKVKIDGNEYTAIWSGKSNYGRKPVNYWACFPLHPYGRCTFTEWYLELEKYFEKD